MSRKPTVVTSRTGFVQRVQRRDIAQPTQKSFDVLRWEKTFTAVESPSVEDRRLYETGLWAFQKFDVIRKRLEDVLLTQVEGPKAIRMYVGEANRSVQILEAKSRSIENLVIAEQIVQARVSRSVEFGGSADPDALLTASIDALRFLLQTSYHSEEKPRLVATDLEALERLKLTILLAQIYNVIDGYWMHSLWNGWFVERTNGVDIVKPPDGICPIISAISDYRRSALMIEMMFHFDREWTYITTHKGKSLLLALLPRVVSDGEEGNWVVEPRKEADGGARALLVNRLKTERGYYQRIVNEPLGELAPVTLHLLLSAWEVLYAIAETLIESFPPIEDSGVFTIDKLTTYAPTLRKQEVMRLISSWCAVPGDVAAKIVDFFCYRKATKWELWGHPLVELDGNSVTPLLAPILHGNMERTMELWMKAAHLDLTGKGTDFERYARSELGQALAASDRLVNAEVIPHAVTLEDSDSEEEIDLILRIGDVILIGEAKCMLFPSEPIEVWRYFEVLSGAASQVRRKTESARRNIDQLLDKTKFREKVVRQNVTIQPFVLINQPFGAGFPIDGVPVVDELIWKRFFEGEYYQMVRTTDDGALRARSIIALYSNEAEAARNIAAYLDNPPQLLHYRQNLRTRLERFPRIDENDTHFAAVSLEVSLPIPDLDL